VLETIPSHRRDFVAFLRTHRELLLQRWEARVLADDVVVPAVRLTAQQLRDHLPGLVDAIIDGLSRHSENGGDATGRGQAIGHAAPAIQYAEHRHRRGYTLAEVLRELSILRIVLVDLCAEQTPAEPAQSVLMHAAIDEAMSTAAIEMERYAVEGRDHVLRVVSHDLRGPLSAVVMGAARLISIGGVDPMVHKRIESIERAAQRMSRLLNDLTDLGTIESGRLQLEVQFVEPRLLLEEASEHATCAGDSHPGVVIEVDAKDLPPVQCDPGRVLQAIANILNNACKVVSQTTGRIRVSAEVRGTALVVVVTDNGPGIAAEDVPHLFERFWRSARAPYVGPGIGLAIVRGIVEAHGGQVWAESAPGQGATISMSLPLHHRATASPALAEG
jgi:signal transduction histidine kinase